MQSAQQLAFMIYLLGVPLMAFLVAWGLPKLPAFLKRREQEAMKEALDPESPRGTVRSSRREAERMRDEWYSMIRICEGLSASGRWTWAALFMGLLWPGLLAFIGLGLAWDGVRNILDATTGRVIECDACEKTGPTAWTLRSARVKARRVGWAVSLPTKEDLCPACAVAEAGVHAPVAER